MRGRPHGGREPGHSCGLEACLFVDVAADRAGLEALRDFVAWSMAAGSGSSSSMRSGGRPGPSPEADRGDPETDRVAALVELARGGDGEAFGLLYDRYVGQVYRYIYHRTGSHPLAEDLTSETFVRALRAIPGFHWRGKDVGAWFVTIARNLVIDHVKSSRFRLEVPTNDLLAYDSPDAHGPEDTVVAAVSHHELQQAIAGAMRRLSPEQQECLTLRFLNGMSIAETALVLGKNSNAVKQLQLRAVRALARHLPQERAR